MVRGDRIRRFFKLRNDIKINMTCQLSEVNLTTATLLKIVVVVLVRDGEVRV